MSAVLIIENERLSRVRFKRSGAKKGKLRQETTSAAVASQGGGWRDCLFCVRHYNSHDADDNTRIKINTILGSSSISDSIIIIIITII